MSEERDRLCTACEGRGYVLLWLDSREEWGHDDCEHCDGSSQEPCPPKGDLERALRRAEEGARQAVTASEIYASTRGIVAADYRTIGASVCENAAALILGDSEEAKR